MNCGMPTEDVEIMGINVLIVMIIVLSVCVVIFLGWLVTKLGPCGIELPEKRAGRLGENFASTVIQEILHEDDVMLTNVMVP